MLPQIHETNSILRAWANFDNSFSYCLKVSDKIKKRAEKFFGDEQKKLNSAPLKTQFHVERRGYR